MTTTALRQVLFSRSAAADAAGARAIRNALQELLSRLGVSSEVRDAMLLATAELVVNPGMHATPPASSVEVILAREGGRWQLEFLDDGGPFDDFATQWSATPDDPLAEGGRGLALVAALLPEATYSSATDCPDGRNRLVLNIPLAPESRPRILLVDDDPATLRLLQLYLDDHYDVITCISAGEALERLNAAPVDLIVSDIRMPGIDGVELRRMLTANAGTDMLPFVFLTGQLENDAAVADLAVDDYLVKPVTAERLRAVVRRVLGRSRQLRARLDERRDMAVTARLQPDLPRRVGPFRCAVRTAAAGPGGGDLLLTMPCRDGVLLVLADLMGHGEAAKFFAHTLAGYLHGLVAASDGDIHPAALLGQVSAGFVDNPLLNETLATLLALRLGDDGTVVVATAGHPAPWQITVEGIAELAVEGALPGLGGDGDYEESSLVLAGDRLALYTDGLVEVGGDPVVETRLRECLHNSLATSRDQSLDMAADAAWSAWREVAGESPADDATLVLLERV